jgi:hypothetical protein
MGQVKRRNAIYRYPSRLTGCWDERVIYPSPSIGNSVQRVGGNSPLRWDPLRELRFVPGPDSVDSFSPRFESSPPGVGRIPKVCFFGAGTFVVLGRS